MTITGLSGNEIYCLAQKGYTPGNKVMGNVVYSKNVIKSLLKGLTLSAGKEFTDLSHFMKDGRQLALNRAATKAALEKGAGIIRLSSDLIYHPNYVEFLSQGSLIHSSHTQQAPVFSISKDGQEFFAVLDAGFKPISFTFGNGVYSLESPLGLLGGFKSLVKGEIQELSARFQQIRQLVLERLCQDAKKYSANAILNIQTDLLPIGNACEMIMVGTASHHPELPLLDKEIITSDLTNIELWNLAKLNYVPLRLLIGNCVYSFGVGNDLSSLMKSFYRKENNALSNLILEAREKANTILNEKARALGADMVVGVKNYVYQLGDGLVEFLAIGTAVKKSTLVKPASEQLPIQAITVDESTFYNGIASYYSTDKRSPLFSFVRMGIIILIILGLVWLKVK